MLRLIVDDVDEFHPNDISYVYSGYAPLSVRLVQCALQKLAAGGGGGSIANMGPSAVSLLSYVGGSINSGGGAGPGTEKSSSGSLSNTSNGSGATITNGWRGYEEILKVLPGKSFEITQTVEYGPETNVAMARAKRKNYPTLIYICI